MDGGMDGWMDTRARAHLTFVCIVQANWSARVGIRWHLLTVDLLSMYIMACDNAAFPPPLHALDKTASMMTPW